MNPAILRDHRQARALAEIGRYGDAEQRIRAALDTAPTDADLLVFLSYLLRNQQRYLEALAACEAALAAAGDSAAARTERAENLLALYRGRESVHSAAEAVRLAPEAPGPHLLLARALSFTGEHDRAREAIGNALLLAPGSVDGLLTLAGIERDAGNRRAAVDAVRAALAVEPTSTHGRWLLGMLDADQLRVRRSMRTLREVAGERAAHRPDVVSLVWPIRRALAGARRWLTVAAVVGALLVLVATAVGLGTSVRPVARVVTGLGALAATVALLRVAVPAGRLPWRCLRLVSRPLRTGLVVGLATALPMVALLVGHAVTGWWVPPVMALVLTPVLWLSLLAERIGASADDPGFRQSLADLGAGFRQLGRDLREWARDTRRELAQAWREPPDPTPR